MEDDPAKSRDDVDFIPYHSDTPAIWLDNLTVENGPETILISGSLAIDRNEQGLKMARALSQIVINIMAKLDQDRTAGLLRKRVQNDPN